MPILERGQAIALVVPGVLVAADADQRLFQEMHDGGQDLLALETAPGEMPLDRASDGRQALREGEHAMVFGAVAHVAKARVIAILLAPFRITARRLDVAIGPGAYPYLDPGRRNGQRLDALQGCRIAYPGVLCRDILEPLAAPQSTNAWPVVADVSQARMFC